MGTQVARFKVVIKDGPQTPETRQGNGRITVDLTPPVPYTTHCVGVNMLSSINQHQAAALVLLYTLHAKIPCLCKSRHGSPQTNMATSFSMKTQISPHHFLWKFYSKENTVTKKQHIKIEFCYIQNTKLPKTFPSTVHSPFVYCNWRAFPWKRNRLLY